MITSPRNLLRSRSLALVAAAVTGFAATAPAQGLEAWSQLRNQRPVVLDNARLITMDGDPIPNGRVVIRDGKITAIGPVNEVTVPPGAETHDLAGATVMPGLVAAFTNAGRGRSTSAGGAAGKIGDKIATRQEVYMDLLRSGVTTLVVAPEGSGAVGLAARVDLKASQDFDREDFIADDDAYLVLGASDNERGVEGFKKLLEKAVAEVEYRENPPKPEPEKKPDPKDKPKDDGKGKGDKKPESQPAPKGEKDKPKEGDKPAPKGDKDKPKQEPKKGDGKDDKKPQKKKERKVDPAVAKLADMLQGKQRTVLLANSATSYAYWQMATDDVLKELLEEDKLKLHVVVRRYDSRNGLPTLLVEQLKEAGGTVFLPPAVPTEANTAYLRHVAAELAAAELEVGFLFGDNPAEIRALQFQMMLLVRHGLPREVALAGVTRVPAEMLGLGKRAGRLVQGGQADLLVFDGDPLDPRSRLREVWLQGEKVPPAGRDKADSKLDR